VSTRLRHLGFQVDAGVADGNTLNKKVRNAQLEQYCFIFVVGATEQDSDCVDIRLGTGARQGQRSIAEVIAHFTVLSKTRGTVVDFPINEQQITEMEATQAKVTHQVEEAKTQLGNISDRLSKLEN